jgi:hypothetical protein
VDDTSSSCSPPPPPILDPFCWRLLAQPLHRGLPGIPYDPQNWGGGPWYTILVFLDKDLPGADMVTVRIGEFSEAGVQVFLLDGQIFVDDVPRSALIPAADPGGLTLSERMESREGTNFLLALPSIRRGWYIGSHCGFRAAHRLHRGRQPFYRDYDRESPVTLPGTIQAWGADWSPASPFCTIEVTEVGREGAI